MPREGSPYAKTHEDQRRAWATKVATGTEPCREITCLMPDRIIRLGQEWDLAHDHDHPGRYRGPAHALCNRSEGGKRGRAKQLGTNGSLRHSRAW